MNAVILVEPFKFLHKIGEGAHDYDPRDKDAPASGAVMVRDGGRPGGSGSRATVEGPQPPRGRSGPGVYVIFLMGVMLGRAQGVDQISAVLEFEPL